MTAKKTWKEKLISFTCDIITALTWILGAIYFPVYCLAWLLHKVSRLLLAISYFGLLDWRKGVDIIKSIFTNYGKLPRI